LSGRIAAGVLGACCLLAPGSLSARGQDPGSPASPAAAEERPLEERVEELERAREDYEEALREQERLERRVEELETEKAAHEDATRSIISQTFREWGSRINQFVSLGGVLEVLTRSEEDFYGKDEESIRLNTAELQLEIQVVDWARGSFVLEYDEGTDLVFPTVEDDEFSVDKINVDTAEIYLGNTERFWPYGRFGRMVVPFGISTGDPVLDVLTLEDPLTVEAFETKDDALVIGFEFPTPPLAPETLIPAPPPVKPRVLNPLVRKLASLLGYEPLPAPPPAPTFITPVPTPPPFSAAVYFYNGDTFQKGKPNREGEWDPTKHFGATLGYRTKGSCRALLGDPGAPDDLSWLHVFCPWTIDADVDFNRSVYDSRFLGFQYRAFLDRIGIVSGLAAHVKATLGPVGIVAEWNGALGEEGFFDDGTNPATGQPTFVAMRPRAWQVSLAYQFDWNPSVESIGAQGTYVAVSYSESQDLAGITRFNNQTNELLRIGFVPKRRFVVDVGEWVLENVRVALEYAYTADYRTNQGGLAFAATPDLISGGTDSSAHAFLAMLTFDW
jgi:hypothetical protein